MTLIRKLINALTVAAYVLLGTVPALPQAALLPNAKQTFVDENGKPLTGGKIWNYVPNTTVPKTTWSNSTQTTPNTNPVTLDSAGRAVIYGQGSYQQRVLKANGDLVWSAPTTAWNASPVSGSTGTDTAPVGTVMPFSGLVTPTNWQFSYGQAISRTDFSDLLTAITVSHSTVACTSSSTILSGWPDTSQIRVGAAVEASCVPTGTIVVKVLNSSQIQVNNSAAATITTTATVFPWGNGDGVSTFNVPDLRGNTIVGPDGMGGTTANRLQAVTTITTVSGSPIVTVASATGLFPGMVIISTNVPVGTTISAIAGVAVTMSGNASASATGTAATFQAFASSNALGASGGAAGHMLTQTELPNSLGVATSIVTDPGHVHNMRGSSSSANLSDPTNNFVASGTTIYHASGTPVQMGTTASGVTGITVATTVNNNVTVATTLSTTNGSPTATVASAAGLFVGMFIASTNVPGSSPPPGTTTITAISGTTVTMSANASATASAIAVIFTGTAGNVSHSVLQPSLTMNYIIKVKSNSTGAGGVVSIQGMFGDILCGVGVDCSNNVISFAGTPSLPLNQIYVGNASNIPTPVTMTGDCSIVSTGTITCRGVTANVAYVTTGGTVTVGDTVTILVINKSVASDTPISLGAELLRSGLPLEIYDFNGNAGTMTITPNGSETIMGVSSWVVTSGGVPGSGGSVRLIPVNSLNGWLAR